MFIAGINFSLHFRLINGDFKAYFKDAEFRVFLFIAVFITIIIFLSLSFQNNLFSSQGLRESLFGTIAILTGTGYVLGDYEIWPIYTQLILLTLMFVGGMGGSTTGGMKVIRILLLVKYLIISFSLILQIQIILILLGFFLKFKIF